MGLFKREPGYGPASSYDPETMGRVIAAAAEGDADPDGRADADSRGSGGGGGGDPETEVLSEEDDAEGVMDEVDIRLDGDLNEDGLTASDMRRGGMTAFDRRCRRAAVCVAALVGVAGASVGIAFASGRVSFRLPGGGGGGNGKASPASRGGGLALTPPPPDLSRTCSPVAVSTKEGWDKCERLCASAECCLLPEGHWFSCKAGNEEMCSAYEYACMTLDHIEGLQKQAGPDGGAAGKKGSQGQVGETSTAKALPIAPGNLGELCSADSLATADGFASCSDACAPAKCCVSNQCAVSNLSECARYEPCLVLDGTPASHPDSASSKAKTKCNTQALTTKEGVKECQDLCEPAMCCFASLSPNANYFANGQVADCLDESTEKFCDQYGPCQGLLHIMNPDGFGQGDVDDNDYVSMDEKAAAAVEEACSTGFRECKNMCDAAACCFRSEDSYCLSIGQGDIQCDHYDACESIFTTTITEDFNAGLILTDLAEAPPDLKMICNSPRPYDVQKCDKYCRPAHCCHESIEYCKVTDPESCDGYNEPCKDTWDGMALETLVPNPPEDISKWCSTGLTPQDGASGSQKSDDCRAACDLAACCTNFGGQRECTVRDPDVCDLYEPFCQALWHPDDVVELGPPPSWLAEACDADPDSSECLEGCRPGLCCGGGQVGCDKYVVDAATCYSYEEVGCADAWSYLVKERDEGGAGGGGAHAIPMKRVNVPDAPSNLDLCDSARPSDLEACVEACRPAYCCFDAAKDCEPVNQGACDSYYGDCSDAWHQISLEVTIPAPPADIDQYCAAGVGQTASAQAKCRADCDLAECCNEDIEFCKVTNPGMCDAYQAHCKFLWGSNPLEIPPPPGNLDQLCSALSLSTDSGRSACDSACRRATCCTEPIEECQVTNPEMCGRYMACAALYGETVEEYDASVTVPRPPEDLADMCSAASLATANGFKHCKETCDLSNCCNSPIEECRVLNPSSCKLYAPCTPLHKKGAGELSGAVVVPPAPDDIGETCSPSSLGTVQGFTECEDVCDRARCCDDPDGGCRAVNLAACSGYTACDKLYDEGGGGFDDHDQATLLKLAEEVQEACSPPSLADHQGQSHCHHLCNDRMCCFDSDPDKTCVDGKECVVFAACENLVTYGYHSNPDGGGSTDTLGDQTPVVGNTCNPESLKTMAGINACHEICAPYLCCWSEEALENCYQSQIMTCDAYDECRAIVQPFGDVEKKVDNLVTKEVVAEACSPSSTKTEEGISNCHALCGPRMCCFVQLGMQSNCVDTLGAECKVYEACAVLADVGDDVTAIGQKSRQPDDNVYATGEGGSGMEDEGSLVNKACSYENFDTEEGRMDCINLCSQRSCCLAPPGTPSCYETDKDWCDEFAACTIIDDYTPLDEYEEEGGDDGGDGEASEVSLKEELNDICSSENLGIPEGFSACHQACDPHPCCWDEMNGCYPGDAESCEEFEGCSRLFEYLDDTNEIRPSTLCAKEKISDPDGRAACQNVCNERSCCWITTTVGNCYEKYPDWCDQYEACLILDSDKASQQDSATDGEESQQGSPNGGNGSQQGTLDTEPVSLESEIDHICSPEGINEDDGEACKRLCSPQSCCFASEEMFNCWDEQPAQCKEFEACQNLYNDDGSQQETDDTKPVSLESEMDHICSPGGIADDGGEACQRLCSPQSCCFAADKKFNCWSEQPVVCKEFEVCENLYSTQGNTDTGKNESIAPSSESQTPPKAEVSKACGDSYALDPQNCKLLCEDAKCCFSTDAASSCRGMTTFCAEYAPCKVVFVQEQANTILPKSEVSKACEENYALDPRNCELLCEDSKCCFSDDPAKSCRGMKTFCAEYAPCMVVFSN